MKVLNLSQDGQLKARDIQCLGGNYNWLEVIRLGGVGSSKFIYVSGIEGFDSIKALSTASDYVSLELLKGGLAIRFKKQNDYKACTFLYEDVDEISVTSQRVRLRFRGREKIVHQADVDVQLGSAEFKLKLSPTYYKAGIGFLNKRPIKEYCNFILLPEIIEESSMDLGWISSLINGIQLF